jgi:D-tyrosyl-tRNA(Tyr) deacylase
MRNQKSQGHQGKQRSICSTAKKVIHPTKTAAKLVIAARANSANGAEVRTYPCNGHWHTTSQARGRKPKEIRNVPLDTSTPPPEAFSDKFYPRGEKLPA